MSYKQFLRLLAPRIKDTLERPRLGRQAGRTASPALRCRFALEHLHRGSLARSNSCTVPRRHCRLFTRKPPGPVDPRQADSVLTGCT
jgi:hypothetical protein